MKKILLAVFVITAVLFSSCKDNGTGPKPEDKPGRRDYTWSVDTIRPFNSLHRMWGSSPTDVWAITSGTYYQDIYHFDGNKWSTGQYTLPNPYGPSSIYGFAANDIYIGAQNRICHFDGSSWKEIAVLSKNGHSYDITFDNMWGSSANDLFAIGAYADNNGNLNESIIAHYTYSKWEMLNTDGLYGIVEHLYRNYSDKKIYLQLIGGRNLTDSTQIYEYTGGKYIKLYSNIWTKGLQADISLINGEVYFILGNRIAKRTNDQFQTFLDVENQNFYHRIWGRNSKDIFLLMTDGVAHYNGTDIEYLFHFTHGNETPWTDIWGASVFEKDVFFMVYEPTTNLNLIYHGKLKD